MLTTPQNGFCLADKHYLNDARSGMTKISPVHLRIGQRYYRFSSTKVSLEKRVSSPWWFEYETYRCILKFAENAELSLGYAARLKAALPFRWESDSPGQHDVNLLVSAILNIPLLAYAGRGKIQEDQDGRMGAMKWIPPPDVKQIYIPGLQDPDTRQPLKLSVSAFKEVESERIHHRFLA